MNHYKFPRIEHISQVFPVIKDRKEFIIAQKDGHTIINYVVAMEDTFPPVTDEATAILRECRGLVFDSVTGFICARRYHKFFNVGERMETSPQFVDLSKPHVVLEKADGSMITPFIDGTKQLRWGSKMGVTDVVGPVIDFLNKNLHYVLFARENIENGYTPIFEWCSRKQKIVVDHPQDRLILTAIRRMMTGEYTPFDRMKHLASVNGIECIQAFNPAPEFGEKYDVHYMLEKIRAWSDSEGIVVRFDDGHMVKVKSEWYMQLHRAKDVTKSEKNVLEIILQDKLDDLLPLLEDDYKMMLESYRSDVFRGLETMSVGLKVLYRSLMANMVSKEKREFAVHHVKTIADKNLHPFMFSMWDGKDPFELLKAELLKSCSSQNRLDNNRWMMNDASYSAVMKEMEDAKDEAGL
jgi:T4 RnlA family RNA ligase